MKIFNESCHRKINLIHVPTPTARELYYYVEWTGHFVCREDFMIDRWGFASYLLLYTVEGEGALSYEGKEYLLTPGTTVLLDCRRRHTYHPTAGSWEFKYIHFDGADSERLSAHLHRVFSSCLVPYAVGIERYFDRVMDSVRNRAPEEVCSALIYRILMTLLGSGLQDSRTGADRLDVSAVMSYIAENYTSDVSVSHLAEIFHMSRTHFSGEFKRLTGNSPHRYLTDFRLAAARRMLISTGRSISEIAERCGFRDSSSFIRSFRASEGISPNAFRKQKR